MEPTGSAKLTFSLKLPWRSDHTNRSVLKRNGPETGSELNRRAASFVLVLVLLATFYGEMLRNEYKKAYTPGI